MMFREPVIEVADQLLVMNRNYSFVKPTRTYRELMILTEIERDSAISQRMLSRRVRVSATMINTYLTDLVERGLIGVEGDTNRSYRYVMTEAGREHRNRLFFECSREIIQFYGRMKLEFKRRLERHYQEGIRRVVLFGAAETGELVSMVSLETKVSIVGIVDSDRKKHGKKIGLWTVTDPESMVSFKPDAVIITSFGHMDEIYETTRHLENQGIRVLKL